MIINYLNCINFILHGKNGRNNLSTGLLHYGVIFFILRLVSFGFKNQTVLGTSDLSFNLCSF